MEENNILIAIIGLGVGAVIGYFAGRSSTSNTSSQEKEVASLKNEMDDYKESVATHFQHTATMINEMNDSYQGVIHHLAKGSQDLCDAGTAKDIESQLIPKIEPTKDKQEEVSIEPQAESTVEPPRDYAPKKPDEVGVLSEDYGVKEKSNEEENKEEEDASKVTPPIDAPIKN